MTDGPGMGRRQVLRYTGAVATAAVTAGGTTPRDDTDRDGLKDREETGALQEDLEAVYGADQVEQLQRNEPDLLVDVVYVQGSDRFRDDHIDWLEDYFQEELGIHAQLLERDAAITQERYEAYETTVDSMIGDDGLYDDHLTTGLEDSMHTLLCIPDGGVTRKAYPLSDEDERFAGYNVGTRSVVGDLDNDFYHVKTAVHELGHSLGLDHIPEEYAAEGRIMTDSAGYVDRLDQFHFTPAEQEMIRANLDSVL